MAKRRNLVTRPVWNGVFEQYSRKWVNKHFWRVAHIHGTKEDSLQECALVFARCLPIYEKTVTNNAWFMALYQRALSNEWNTCAQKDAKRRAIVGPSMDDPDNKEQYADIADLGSSNLAEAFTHLRTCGIELLDALANIAMAPGELLRILAKRPSQEVKQFINCDDEFLADAAKAFLRVRLGEGAEEADAIINDLCELLDI